MDLAVLIRIIRRKLWLLILIPSIAAIAAFLFSMNLKKYSSTARIATGFTTNESIRVTDERVDNSAWSTNTKFESLIEKLNSELVLALVSYNLMIHDLTSENPYRSIVKNDTILSKKSKAEIDTIVNKFRKKLEKMELLSIYNPGENELITLTKEFGYSGWTLKGDITTKRVRISDYLDISYTSENPFLSADVVNTLCEQFIRYDNNLRLGNTSESVSFFAELVDEKKKILDERTSYLNQFKTTNNIYSDDFTMLKSSQIVNYEVMRQEKLDKITGKKLMIANIDKQLQSQQTGENVSEVNVKILQIRSKISELNQIYVNGGSTDQELANTIAGLRTQLQTEMNKLDANFSESGAVTREKLLVKKQELELELGIENASLNTLNETIASLKGSISGTMSKSSAIESLTREVSTASQEYLEAVEKYNIAKNKSLVSKSPISIVQQGQPRNAPDPSKRMFIIALSAMASLSLCVLVFIIIEFIDQRIKTPSKFENITNLKLLGSANKIQQTNLDLKNIFTSKLTEDKSLETLRHLLRKIRFEIESSGAQVLLFTSTKRGEGKTFIIISLAYTLSLLNKRILIIDTNFRNNSLTRLLVSRPANQKMLQAANGIKILPPQKQQEPENSDIIYRTNDKNIDIIGSNTGIESPSEVLAGRNFKNMIDQLRNNYDYIFMEGACLNEYSDTKELMTYSDKLISVFSAESVLQQIDHESIAFINDLNGKFMGAILNKLDTRELA